MKHHHKKRVPRWRDESWVENKWRPAMAWMYFVICLFDFLVGPILLGLFNYYTKSTYVPWHPLTLEGGGLFHMALGAIIGVTSWSRGMEKLKSMDNPDAIPDSDETVTSSSHMVSVRNTTTSNNDDDNNSADAVIIEDSSKNPPGRTPVVYDDK